MHGAGAAHTDRPFCSGSARSVRILTAVTTYRVFGLALESELEFTELPEVPSGTEPALRLRLRSLPDPRPADEGEGEHWFGSHDGASWFDWRGVARVRIDSGNAIDLDPVEGVDAKGLRSAILGPVFTVVLLQRGLYPLHAGSVVIDGRAVAFAAASGSGKSTLALALAERGHGFLSDDVTAISFCDENGVLAWPAFPQLKLLPDLIDHRGEEAEAMPLVNPVETKRAHALETGCAPGAAPLTRVFLLGEGPLGVGEPLERGAAFAEAVRHGHRAGLHARVVGEPERMARCAALASRVPFQPLTRPNDLGGLDALVRLVEREATR